MKKIEVICSKKLLLSDNLVVNDRVHFNANDKLSKCRFRKGFNTQQGLLKILMKLYLIQEESLVRCLSKALDCLGYDKTECIWFFYFVYSKTNL